MASTAAPIMIEEAFEHFSAVWVELTLAIFAVIAYVALSGGSAKRKAAKKCPDLPPVAKPARAPLEVHAPRQARRSSDPPPPPSVPQLAAKALRQGNLNDSIALIQQLPETIAGSVPPSFATRLLGAVAKVERLSEVLPDLKPLAGKITAGALETVIKDAVENKEFAACRRLHIISSDLLIPKSQQTFEALASAYASNTVALRALVEEAHMAAFRTPLPLPFATKVLQGCVGTDLAAEVIEKASKTDAAALQVVLAQATAKSGVAADAQVSNSDKSTSPRSSEAASASSASAATEKETPKEVALRANDIRSCGRNGDLAGAVKVFERLGEQADHVLILNSILDACVECKDMEKAFEYFDTARCQGLADVVSYNTMIKGYVATGQEHLAKRLLTEISLKGLTPTRASYHGLMNSRVNAKDLAAAWKLVSDMQATGMSPNAVTCSILLKGKLNSAQEVSRVLALIDAMDEPMDEVLFLSVVEACIRTGRLDSLSRQMAKFMKQSSSAGLTAPTYGSMIKAYGHARDVKRVWELWNQMMGHCVMPTSVTMGCMVEALVANGCTNDAWKLTQKMWSDENTRLVVNTVIYSSILKGFANTQDTDKVMAVYEEMRCHGIHPNTITFNTILNAFAKNGTMQRVPALLDDMAKVTPPIELDIVSYSTIVKGYCNSGNLDRAFKVVQEMKARGKHVPDEVMYNSLLAGCAKEHRADEAVELLDDMRKFGVAPSNYTLSMLVKLMGRCRRINQVFTMLEDISQEYGLKINIQVYTCLIQGCFNCGQAHKAITVHDKIIKEGLTPDSMTYTVLVRGCLQAGLAEQAVHLAKWAYGKAPEQESSRTAAPGLNPACLDELMTTLSSNGDQQAKALLADLAECQIQSAPGRSAPQTWNRGNTGTPHQRSNTGASWQSGDTGASWRQQRA